jgi:hypothetical protein
MHKGWPNCLFPLTVWYSPILRLRYRHTLGVCCDCVNTIVGRVVLSTPLEPPRSLAVAIEKNLVQPPLGTIYVEDSEGRSDTDGYVRVFEGEASNISGIVYLPESEGELSTVSVTLHALCQVLGMPVCEDTSSIMCKNEAVRPHRLSEQDCQDLTTIFCVRP